MEYTKDSNISEDQVLTGNEFALLLQNRLGDSTSQTISSSALDHDYHKQKPKDGGNQLQVSAILTFVTDAKIFLLLQTFLMYENVKWFVMHPIIKFSTHSNTYIPININRQYNQPKSCHNFYKVFLNRHFSKLLVRIPINEPNFLLLNICSP